MIKQVGSSNLRHSDIILNNVSALLASGNNCNDCFAGVHLNSMNIKLWILGAYNWLYNKKLTVLILMVQLSPIYIFDWLLQF